MVAAIIAAQLAIKSSGDPALVCKKYFNPLLLYFQYTLWYSHDKILVENSPENEILSPQEKAEKVAVSLGQV